MPNDSVFRTICLSVVLLLVCLDAGPALAGGSLVGTWRAGPEGVGPEITFTATGQVIFKDNVGTYHTRGNSVVMDNWEGKTVSFSYQVSSSTLKLTPPGGSPTMEFIRVGPNTPDPPEIPENPVPLPVPVESNIGS